MIIYPQILGLVSSSVTIPPYRRKTQQNSDRALQKQQPQQPQMTCHQRYLPGSSEMFTIVN